MRARFFFLICSSLAVGGVVACTSDVDYLRKGNDPSNVTPKGGSAGASTSGGSTGLSGAGGGGGVAGTTNGVSGSSGNGVGATAGSGGSAGNRCVSNPRIIERFDFTNPTHVIDTSQGGIKNAWVKGPWDSTDTSTGAKDSTGNPPLNPSNIANKSKLEVDNANGHEKPAMKLNVPFIGNPPQDQHMHLLEIYANYQEPAAAVDMTDRLFSAEVQLAVSPHPNCTIKVNMWSTGTDALGQLFNHVDGSEVTLQPGVWTSVGMDLNISAPVTAVNQIGFAIHSNCTPVSAEGGAGGEGGAAGAGGASAGGAGSGGQTSKPMTVLLFDNITVNCR